MIVFNLHCEHEHRFEGWFANADAFDTQLEQGLVQCPMCNSAQIKKALSAPRLNFGATESAERAVAPASSGQRPSSDEQVALLQGQMLRKMREFLRNTENVGDQFASEARAIHYGQKPERAIRGTTTSDEREQLHHEGIEVFAMSVPDGLDEPLQ